MKEIKLNKNEYKALKLHWAGNHQPSNIAEKCGITYKRYLELVKLSQQPNIIIKEV